MAISKITTRGISGDTLEAGDIAANAVGASELADNAVDTAAIASEAVTAPKVVDGLIEVKPHIKPGVLHPAWEGLLTDNTAYTFTDSGATGHAVTPSGNIHHSGVTSKIGSTSLNFDGTGDYLSVADHADFDISGQFTIECWVNFRTKTNYDGIITFDGTGAADFALGFAADNKLHLFSHAGNATSVVNSSDTINLNQWYHVAISRDGSNNTRFYLDGVHKTVSTSYTAAHTTTSGGVKVGRYYTADDEKYFDGFLDQLRVSNTARYTGTSSFTPSTSAYSSDSNTKLLLQSDNGGHVGAYGTAQTDGKSYYYTDIKGSKPIKDPRIGGYFGSQRFQMTSIQSLEQESATHGRNVYTIDGREFMRAVGTITMVNNLHGNYIDMEDDDSPMAFIELVGYFNDANISLYCSTNIMAKAKVNGGSLGNNLGTSAIDSPLGGRFVHNGSLVNTEITATLGINTLRIEPYSSSGHNTKIHALELIAQDTSSDANKLKIQIPAQNVVSYGKKFSIPATAQHYDPFNGFTNETDNHNTYIDYATSLGTDGWKNGSNYYRPYNGGRVVKWVDSSGAIKTSVNMMPPNARSIKNADISKKANASVVNDTYLPTFEAGVIDHSQSEVAKTFHWREFGNGAVNGGTNRAYWADLSMVSTAGSGTNGDEVAYVMDDGLTSMSTDHAYVNNATEENNTGIRIALHTGVQNTYFTFIGTGFSAEIKKWSTATFDAVGNQNLVQNLPYGTHIVKIARDNTGTDQVTLTVDGVVVQVEATGVDDKSLEVLRNLTFHQPKMPPIPEDACIISDYMLMADYVKQTDVEYTEISKGVRYVNGSRDHFCNTGGALSATPAVNVASQYGLFGGKTPSSTHTGDFKLPFFGTTGQALIESSGGAHVIKLGGATATKTTLNSESTGDNENNQITISGNTNGDVTLGMTNIESVVATGSYRFYGHHVVTPIHTSSHYQTFETSFLHELVGGDRNMEQHNLIVTADGKTWDSVTRDTSYIGNSVLQTTCDSGDFAYNVVVPFDEWRGLHTDNAYRNWFNKDFAIAYDRIICLVDGEYEVTLSSCTQENSNYFHCGLTHNGTTYDTYKIFQIGYVAGVATGTSPFTQSAVVFLKRGDYLQVWGGMFANNRSHTNGFHIKRA